MKKIVVIIFFFLFFVNANAKSILSSLVNETGTSNIKINQDSITKKIDDELGKVTKKIDTKLDGITQKIETEIQEKTDKINKNIDKAEKLIDKANKEFDNIVSIKNSVIFSIKIVGIIFGIAFILLLFLLWRTCANLKKVREDILNLEENFKLILKK
jgi:predicted PurR-regulated permease PerM